MNTNRLRYDMKRIWMNMVYSSICGSYLVKSRKERTLDMMEKVLFLMQVESLKTLKRPFLKYPIFIHGKDIRVAYISDLLRVQQPICQFSYKDWIMFYDLSSLDPYHKMLNRYRRYSKEQLDEAVDKILSEEALDDAYFKYGEYYDCVHLRKARIKINSVVHYFLNFIRLCLLTAAVAMVFASLRVASLSQTMSIEPYQDRLLSMFIISIVMTMIGLIWTRRWMVMTTYERKAGKGK